MTGIRQRSWSNGSAGLCSTPSRSKARRGPRVSPSHATSLLPSASGHARPATRWRHDLGAGDRADLDHPALMGADADGPVAFLDLDVEAQLAAVDDLVQLREGGAGLSLGGRGDVL